MAEVVHGLAEGLASHAGHEVTVLTRRCPGVDRTPPGCSYRVRGYPWWPRAGHRAEYLSYSVRMLQLATKADVVLLADLITQRATLQLPNRLTDKWPIWLVSYGSELIQHASFGHSERTLRLFGSARGVIAISEYTAGLVRDLCEKARVHVIYPGIRQRVLDAPLNPERSQELARRVPGGAGPLLVCVGRLDARKGQAMLIETLAVLLKRGFAARLCLVGTGPEAESLVEQARLAGVSGSLHFAGEVSEEDKIAWLDAAAMVVQPSRRHGDMVEGLGLAMAEAGARSRAVISTRHGGVPEVVQTGESGSLLAEDATPVEWAEAIEGAAQPARAVSPLRQGCPSQD